MQTLNVRQFRNIVPHLQETFAREPEIMLVSAGKPLARMLPPDPVKPRFESLASFRAQFGAMTSDSTAGIRAERDRH